MSKRSKINKGFQNSVLRGEHGNFGKNGLLDWTEPKRNTKRKRYVKVGRNRKVRVD